MVWEYDRENVDYKPGDETLFYEGLVWRGLKNTKTYKNLDSVKRERMNKIVARILEICNYNWE